MPKLRLIIPFRNILETNFEVSPWYIAESVYITEVLGEDFVTIYKEDQEKYAPVLSATTNCLYMDDPPEDAIDTLARSLATQVQYVLKTFASSPILLSHALLIQNPGPNGQLSGCVELLNAPFPHSLKNNSCVFNAGTSEKAVHDWFSVVETAGKKYDPIHITLSRFNSSLIRSDPLDRIIDLTISMESLIRSSYELKFKFALFNALLSEPRSEKRFEQFELLQRLYDARSSVVHGDITKGAQKKIDEVIKKFNEIVLLAQAAINYYLLFLFENSPEEWSEHFEKLALGVSPRLTE